MSDGARTRRGGARAAVVLFLAAGGCRTSPTPRFYSLSSLKGPSAAPPGEHAAVIAVGPVAVPDSVDRPELVTVIGPNQLAVHDFDRWAGDLGRDLESAIVQDLAAALAPGRFALVPWTPGGAGPSGRRRLTVSVTRFELSAGPGGGALLEAEWALHDPAGGVLAMNKSSERAPAQGREIKDLVAAMSQCVRQLSALMAQSIAASSER